MKRICCFRRPQPQPQPARYKYEIRGPLGGFGASTYRTVYSDQRIRPRRVIPLIPQLPNSTAQDLPEFAEAQSLIQPPARSSLSGLMTKPSYEPSRLSNVTSMSSESQDYQNPAGHQIPPWREIEARSLTTTPYPVTGSMVSPSARPTPPTKAQSMERSSGVERTRSLVEPPILIMPKPAAAETYYHAHRQQRDVGARRVAREKLRKIDRQRFNQFQDASLRYLQRAHISTPMPRPPKKSLHADDLVTWIQDDLYKLNGGDLAAATLRDDALRIHQPVMSKSVRIQTGNGGDMLLAPTSQRTQASSEADKKMAIQVANARGLTDSAFLAMMPRGLRIEVQKLRDNQRTRVLYKSANVASAPKPDTARFAELRARVAVTYANPDAKSRLDADKFAELNTKVQELGVSPVEAYRLLLQIKKVLKDRALDTSEGADDAYIDLPEGISPLNGIDPPLPFRKLESSTRPYPFPPLPGQIELLESVKTPLKTPKLLGEAQGTAGASDSIMDPDGKSNVSKSVTPTAPESPTMTQPVLDTDATPAKRQDPLPKTSMTPMKSSPSPKKAASVVAADSQTSREIAVTQAAAPSTEVSVSAVHDSEAPPLISKLSAKAVTAVEPSTKSEAAVTKPSAPNSQHPAPSSGIPDTSAPRMPEQSFGTPSITPAPLKKTVMAPVKAQPSTLKAKAPTAPNVSPASVEASKAPTDNHKPPVTDSMRIVPNPAPPIKAAQAPVKASSSSVENSALSAKNPATAAKVVPTVVAAPAPPDKAAAAPSSPSELPRLPESTLNTSEQAAEAGIEAPASLGPSSQDVKTTRTLAKLPAPPLKPLPAPSGKAVTPPMNSAAKTPELKASASKSSNTGGSSGARTLSADEKGLDSSNSNMTKLSAPVESSPGPPKMTASVSKAAKPMMVSPTVPHSPAAASNVPDLMATKPSQPAAVPTVVAATTPAPPAKSPIPPPKAVTPVGKVVPPKAKSPLPGPTAASIKPPDGISETGARAPADPKVAVEVVKAPTTGDVATKATQPTVDVDAKASTPPKAPPRPPLKQIAPAPKRMPVPPAKQPTNTAKGAEASTSAVTTSPSSGQTPVPPAVKISSKQPSSLSTPVKDAAAEAAAGTTAPPPPVPPQPTLAKAPYSVPLAKPVGSPAPSKSLPTPTAKPSATPSATPSAKPSATPSATPSAKPSAKPSGTPTESKTVVSAPLKAPAAQPKVSMAKVSAATLPAADPPAESLEKAASSLVPSSPGDQSPGPTPPISVPFVTSSHLTSPLIVPEASAKAKSLPVAEGAPAAPAPEARSVSEPRPVPALASLRHHEGKNETKINVKEMAKELGKKLGLALPTKAASLKQSEDGASQSSSVPVAAIKKLQGVKAPPPSQLPSATTSSFLGMRSRGEEATSSSSDSADDSEYGLHRTTLREVSAASPLLGSGTMSLRETPVALPPVRAPHSRRARMMRILNGSASDAEIVSHARDIIKEASHNEAEVHDLIELVKEKLPDRPKVASQLAESLTQTGAAAPGLLEGAFKWLKQQQQPNA